MATAPGSDKKAAREYRLTERSIPWLIALLILPIYEVLAIVFKWDGGALSHLFWWAYGPQGGLRWWLLGCGFIGWSAWCCWHFMARSPGLPELLSLVAAGLLVGLVGFLISQ